MKWGSIVCRRMRSSKASGIESSGTWSVEHGEFRNLPSACRIWPDVILSQNGVWSSCHPSPQQASHAAEIYTNDSHALGDTMAHDVAKTSALDLSKTLGDDLIGPAVGPNPLRLRPHIGKPGVSRRSNKSNAARGQRHKHTDCRCDCGMNESSPTANSESHDKQIVKGKTLPELKRVIGKGRHVGNFFKRDLQ